MDLIRIVFLFVISTQHLIAQQIPFQGKLLENGSLVNGQRNFVFSINIGTINWTETHANEVVTNGLYALVLGQNSPLPLDLFAAQNSVPLAIQVNGQSLPSTTLYAPFENDPTVLVTVKDGVSWDEVTDKPALDESTTNEIQQLTLNGNDLSITGGNTVQLSSLANPTESFTVGTQETTTVTALEQLSFNGTFSGNSVWQSFSILDDASLEQIEVTFANFSSIDVRLRLYQGEGTSTQALLDHTYPGTFFSASLLLQTFDIASIASVNLEAGQVYTFSIQGIGDDLTFREDDNNPYTFGRIDFDPNTDATFKIVVKQTSGFLLDVSSTSTNVGTDLDVNGRIRDSKGLIMPVGTILPFAGATIPEGWLLCDGIAVRRDLYADLFAVIGINWGYGDASATFNLPDLRGQFLRGVANGNANDPDRDSRIAFLPGGNTGDNVGTYQLDAFQGHYHRIEDSSNNVPLTAFAFSTGSTDRVSFQDISNWDKDTHFNARTIYGDGVNGEPRVTSETRPQNAYVNYIIKY